MEERNKKHIQYVCSFAVLVILLLLPNITGLFMARDITGFWLSFIYIISAVLYLGIGLMFIPQRLFFYIYAPLFVLNTVELIYQVMNHMTTSVMFIYTIVAAEKGEFFELVTSYWPILLLFFLLLALYLFLNRKYIPQEYIIQKQNVRNICLTLFVLWYVIGGCVLYLFKQRYKVNDDDYESPTAYIGMTKSCPINFFVQSTHLVMIWEQINGENRNLQDFRFGISPVADDDSDIIVFLIGETSRYDHWSVNGYERETSPMLSARSNLIHYDSCFSVANLTAISVPYMLSRATPLNQQPYAHERSLVEAFQEAGYVTSWLADQSLTNIYLRRISSNCDYSQYLTAKKASDEFYDLVLVEPFEKRLTEEKRRQFIVLHSLGCHYKYTYRYPDDYKYFSPDLDDIGNRATLFEDVVQRQRFIPRIDGESLINNIREMLVNSYDNSILYSDFFIDTIIDRLQSTHRPAFLVYVGDHGENLMDDERLMLLHGTYAGSKWEYHVPLFVWTSDEYMAKYPRKIAAMEQNRSKRISTMNLFHSFLDMADIDYPLLEKEKCIDDTLLVPDCQSWCLDANLQLMLVPN